MAENTLDQTLTVNIHPPVNAERVIDLNAKPYVLLELDINEEGQLVHTEIQAGNFADVSMLGQFLHDTGNNVASIEVSEDGEADGFLPDSIDLTGRRGAPEGVTLDLAAIDAQLEARG